MIVISGALVLVAAVLLVLGIVSSITLVYAAIGLSLVSAVFLLVGVFQRPAPGSEPDEAAGETMRRQAPAKPKTVAEQPRHEEPEAQAVDAEDAEDAEDADLDAAADYPLEAANADFEERSAATDADVLVISGRPRYHVGGCEYVEGNDDSEPIELNEARELGFTPCGVCRPNETLARRGAGGDQVEPAAPATPPAAAAAPVAPTAPVAEAPTVSAPVVAAQGHNGTQNGVPDHHAPQVESNGVAAAPAAPVTAAQPAVAAPAMSQPVAPATPAPAAEPVAPPAPAAPAPPAAAAPAPTAAPAPPAAAAPAPLPLRPRPPLPAPRQRPSRLLRRQPPPLRHLPIRRPSPRRHPRRSPQRRPPRLHRRSRRLLPPKGHRLPNRLRPRAPG